MRKTPDPERAAAIAYWKGRPASADEPALFWSWYSPRNFGDWITPWLYRRMTGREPRFCPVAETEDRDCIFAAGSILRHLRHPGRVTVWGSGIINRDDSFAAPRRTLAVRGPLTRARVLALGYPCPAVFGDPAILLPLFLQPAADRVRRPFGIAPHFVDRARLGAMALPAGMVIDVTQPVEEVVAGITACDCIFASSLHGLIVAHAYGIPAVWIRSGTPIMGDDTKFHDYYASVGLQVDPLELPSPTTELLERHAAASTLPDQSPLRAPLLAACPFPSRDAGG